MTSDKELLANWMIQNEFATGHGDTTQDLLTELTWQVKEIGTNYANAIHRAAGEIKLLHAEIARLKESFANTSEIVERSFETALLEKDAEIEAIKQAHATALKTQLVLNAEIEKWKASVMSSDNVRNQKWSADREFPTANIELLAMTEEISRLRADNKTLREIVSSYESTQPMILEARSSAG